MPNNNETWFVEQWTEDHDGTPPPYAWVICGCCHGEGTSVSYLGAYTQADREEMGDEWYQFMHDVKSGMYDRACPDCDGLGRQREFTGEAEGAWAEWCQEEADDRYIRWAESGYPQW